MHPHLFGIEWLESYLVMMVIGMIFALFILRTYSEKMGIPYKTFNFYLIIGVVSIVIGLVSAFLFQQIYNYIDDMKHGREFYARGLTFMGGLIGGVVTFLLGVKLFGKEEDRKYFFKVISIAAFGIAFAHFFGRVGCTLAGCCYGVETDAWFGIKFITTTTEVIPTQLIEALFLLILSFVLMVLLNKNKWQYNIFIYGISYAIFRFIIEFFRGDARGTFLPLFSPSQWQVLFMFVISLVTLMIYYRKNRESTLKTKE